MRKTYFLISLLLLISAVLTTPQSGIYGQEIIEVPDEQAFFWTKPTTYKWTRMNPLAPGTPTVTWLSYEYLTIQDEVSIMYNLPYEYGIRPLIAESWRWVDDVTFEIKIRDSVYFWSGRPVTADDVIFSIWLLMRREIPGPLAAVEGIVEDLVKVDDHTLRIKLKPDQAHNMMVYWILTGTYVLPKYQWEPLWKNLGRDIITYNLMEHLDEMDASGPYKPLGLKESVAYFKRVENYWGEKLGWLFAPEYYVQAGDRSSDMMFRLIGERKRDMCSLTAEISLEWQRARPYLGAWNIEGEAWEVHGLHGGSCKALFFNFEKDPIFRELWFREALAYAIDAQKVVDVATFSQGLPANHIFLYPLVYMDYIQMSKSILERHFKYVVDTPDGPRLGYNPELAIQILKEHCDEGSSVETGWFYKGRKLGGWGIIYVADWRSWASSCEAISEMLREIGIEINLVPLEWPAYFDASTTGNWELAFSWHPGGTYPPTGIQYCFENAYAARIWPQAPYTVSLCGFQRFWNGSYPPLPALADQVRELTNKLWYLSAGSAEFNATYMRLLELVLPQLPMIPIFNEACEKTWNRIDRWVNWPTVDDPYDYRIQDCGTLPCSWNPLRRLYPAKVETLSFTLSKNTVRVGETVIAFVTLRNNGKYEQRYKVVVNLGPAKPGWELTEEGILAWKIVKVPPGGTITVDLPVTIEEPGSYVLVVDNWRIGKYDPGDPLEQILTVTAPPAMGLEDISRVVGEIKDTVLTIESSIRDLTTTISSLSLTVSDLSRTVAYPSTLLYVTIGLQVIVLIIVLIVVAMLFRIRK